MKCYYADELQIDKAQMVKINRAFGKPPKSNKELKKAMSSIWLAVSNIIDAFAEVVSEVVETILEKAKAWWESIRIGWIRFKHAKRKRMFSRYGKVLRHQVISRKPVVRLARSNC